MSKIRDVIHRKLLFVSGKGGVGKTVVSQAIALSHSLKQTRTLWVCLEDPVYPPWEMKPLNPHLWHFNNVAEFAFEEYVGLKIRVPALTKIFVQNKLMKYLAKAAPGIHELVLLGKIWYELKHYDHIVVDMPSTGYGLAMFQSTANFANLFKGGPIQKDAISMLENFGDPTLTGQLITALPEEMPLRESLELEEIWSRLFPKNSSAFVVNRCFPSAHADKTAASGADPTTWNSPVPSSAMDYAQKRYLLEQFNLRLWREERIPYGELDFIPPPLKNSHDFIVRHLAEQLAARGYV